MVSGEEKAPSQYRKQRGHRRRSNTSGAYSRRKQRQIGAGSVVIKPVPAGATVVGVPGRTVEETGRILPLLEHAELPGPLTEIIRDIAKEQEQINQRLSSLERRDRMEV